VNGGLQRGGFDGVLAEVGYVWRLRRLHSVGSSVSTAHAFVTESGNRNVTRYVLGYLGGDGW
jgi:hypothetical protein